MSKLKKLRVEFLNVVYYGKFMYPDEIEDDLDEIEIIIFGF